MPNYLQDEYNRINNPNYAPNEINRRFSEANPELQKRLAMIRADLNRRGLFSASPVARSEYGAVSGLQNQISSDVYGNIDQQRMQLIQLLTQLQEAQRARRDQRNSSLFGGIGNLLGTVLGQGIGYFQTRNLMNLLNNNGGNQNG